MHYGMDAFEVKPAELGRTVRDEAGLGPEQPQTRGEKGAAGAVFAGASDWVEFPAKYTPNKMSIPAPAMTGERVSPKSHHAKTEPIKGSPSRQAETTPALR